MNLGVAHSVTVLKSLRQDALYLGGKNTEKQKSLKTEP